MEAAGLSFFSGVSPGRDHWLNAGSGVSGAHYALIFSQTGARVEFVLSGSSGQKNKAMFDHLFTRKSAIESAFGAALNWRRMDDKKASINRVCRDIRRFTTKQTGHQ